MRILGRGKDKRGNVCVGIRVQVRNGCFGHRMKVNQERVGNRKQRNDFDCFLSMISGEEQNELLQEHHQIIILTLPKQSHSLQSTTSITSFAYLSLPHKNHPYPNTIILPFHSPPSSKPLSSLFSPAEPSYKQPLLLIWSSRSYKIMIPNPESKQNPPTHANIPHNQPNVNSHCCKEHSTTPNSADDRSNYTRVAYRSSHTSCRISSSSNHQEDLTVGLGSLKQQLSCSNQHQLLRTYNNLSLLDTTESTKVSLQLILAHRLTTLNPKHQPIFHLAIQAYQTFHFPLI